MYCPNCDLEIQGEEQQECPVCKTPLVDNPEPPPPEIEEAQPQADGKIKDLIADVKKDLDETFDDGMNLQLEDEEKFDLNQDTDDLLREETPKGEEPEEEALKAFDLESELSLESADSEAPAAEKGEAFDLEEPATEKPEVEEPALSLDLEAPAEEGIETPSLQVEDSFSPEETAAETPADEAPEPLSLDSDIQAEAAPEEPQDFSLEEPATETPEPEEAAPSLDLEAPADETPSLQVEDSFSPEETAAETPADEAPEPLSLDSDTAAGAAPEEPQDFSLEDSEDTEEPVPEDSAQPEEPGGDLSFDLAPAESEAATEQQPEPVTDGTPPVELETLEESAAPVAEAEEPESPETPSLEDLIGKETEEPTAAPGFDLEKALVDSQPIEEAKDLSVEDTVIVTPEEASPQARETLDKSLDELEKKVATPKKLPKKKKGSLLVRAFLLVLLLVAAAAASLFFIPEQQLRQAQQKLPGDIDLVELKNQARENMTPVLQKGDQLMTTAVSKAPILKKYVTSGDEAAPAQPVSPRKVAEKQAPAEPTEPKKVSQPAPSAGAVPLQKVADTEKPLPPEMKKPVTVVPKPATPKKVVAKKPAPAQPATAKKVSRPAPVKKAAPSVRYAVHTDSYKRKTNAENEIRRLKKMGFSTYMETVNLKKKGTWYRVKVGPFNSRDKALKVRRELRAKADKQDAVINKLKP